jgi:hypothetical protein
MYEEVLGMRLYRSVMLVVVGVFCVMSAATPASAQVPDGLKEFGAPVYPAFEGWYNNPDGTATLLVGFFNRNSEETIDLPVGELNHFSPGPEDRGQPTHFPPGRSWGVLTIQVPGDFDSDFTWTLTANNQPASIALRLRPPYFIEPLRDAANGNEPPTIRFAPDGEGFTGPPVGIAHTLTATVGAPVELAVWISDVKPAAAEGGGGGRGGRRPALTLRWHLLRGPGEVEFADTTLPVTESDDQNPTTTATFGAPGEYLIRAEGLDSTGVGGGGFQCCWTSAIVRVTVSP